MAGADVNKADAQYGCTPLYRAAENGHAECGELLLDAPGIDVNKKDWLGRTPLSATEKNTPMECIKLLEEAGGHK